jgi:hypothetical protein
VTESKAAYPPISDVLAATHARVARGPPFVNQNDSKIVYARRKNTSDKGSEISGAGL